MGERGGLGLTLTGLMKQLQEVQLSLGKIEELIFLLLLLYDKRICKLAPENESFIDISKITSYYNESDTRED